MTEIIPAILTNDISDFRQKYAELFALSHYFTKLHIDFIDGDFLPKKTIQIKDMAGFKSTLTLIAHLMTGNPRDYFEDAKKQGFSYVFFHFEAFDDPAEIQKTIDKARELGLKVGLSINPETKLYEAAKFIDKVDVIQIMGVHPGAQGRAFEQSVLDKIRELRNLSKNVIICVDGGVKVGVVRDCVLAGANWLVAGSAILQSDNQKMSIEALKADSEVKPA
jgi:ribulose-phosphate 3-epimerase